MSSNVTGLADAMRVFVISLGGFSFGLSFPVAREWIRTTTRFDALAARLFFVVHLLVVLFIAGVLAYRFGDPLWWPTPLAAAIFTLKATILLIVREGQRGRAVRGEHPGRRGGDPT